MSEVTSEQQLVDKVNAAVARVTGVDFSKITKEADITDDLDCDSLGIVELMMELEGDFNIEIKDEDAEKVKTMDDLYGLVARLVSPPENGNG